MHGLTKTPHTNGVLVLIGQERYLIPKSNRALKEIERKIKPFRVEESDSLTPEEVFKDLLEKPGKTGSLIRGYRYRENMSQIQLAKLIHVTQGDLSKMEGGKKAVGKIIAKRLAKVFKTDYRLFL